MQLADHVIKVDEWVECSACKEWIRCCSAGVTGRRKSDVDNMEIFCKKCVHT